MNCEAPPSNILEVFYLVNIIKLSRYYVKYIDITNKENIPIKDYDALIIKIVLLQVDLDCSIKIVQIS